MLKKLAMKTAPAKKSLAAVPEKRPPQRPGRKTASDAELKERYEDVAQALLEGKTKGEIKRQFAEWDLSVKMWEIYITRARGILVEWHDFAQGSDKRIEAVAAAAGLYRKIMHDENASNRDRIHATSEFVDLFGLDAPMRVAQTKTDGTDAEDPLAIIDFMSEEDLVALTEIQKRAQAIRTSQMKPALAAGGRID